jgi:hypothetical protein
MSDSLQQGMRKFLDKITFDTALQCLVVLNVIDAASTHLALKIGIAWEVNPLLRWAYSVSPDIFWLVKMVWSSGACCSSASSPARRWLDPW